MPKSFSHNGEKEIDKTLSFPSFSLEQMVFLILEYVDILCPLLLNDLEMQILRIQFFLILDCFGHLLES